MLCVLSLEFTRQAERIVRRCSRRTLEHPKRGAPTAAVPHTALSDGMFCLEAGGGVQLACGRCHRPAEPSCLRSAARVGWRRRAPCRPRTSYVLALGAKQPAPNTQCRVNCARRLIWPIRALRQQAATCGSEWPRESGARPWRVPTHSGFTRPRSGMKGPDWGLAGAGTTVKRPPFESLVFCPSRFRTVVADKGGVCGGHADPAHEAHHGPAEHEHSTVREAS